MITDPVKEWILLDSVMINPVQYEQSPATMHSCYNALPFLYQHLLEHKFSLPLLRSIGNMYVMVGLKRSEHLIKPDEKKWEDIMSRKGLTYLDTYGAIPLGFIIVDTTPDQYVGIRWLESFVDGYNIGAHMIRCVERQLQKRCIPLTVDFSFGFWVRYFMHYLKLQSSRELRIFFRSELGVPMTTMVGYRDMQVALDMARKKALAAVAVSSAGTSPSITPPLEDTVPLDTTLLDWGNAIVLDFVSSESENDPASSE